MDTGLALIKAGGVEVNWSSSTYWVFDDKCSKLLLLRGIRFCELDISKYIKKCKPMFLSWKKSRACPKRERSKRVALQ